MIERTNFSIFARSNAAPAELPVDVERPAAIPHPDPLPEGAQAEVHRTPFRTEPAPFGRELGETGEGSASDSSWNGSVGEAPALADQLHLTPETAITLRAILPDQPPQPLAASTGLYQPTTDAEPQGEPQTGLAAGTRILTARGEVAVELLQPGDAALGLRGPALLPIAWIGRRAGAKPGVQINPGALGPDMPRRALRLACDHPVFTQPTPVPARSLVNGSSIQAVDLDGTELFHIDVGPSDVLFAEGVPLSSDRRAEA